MVDLLVQRSDVNKDLGLKAKDLGPKAKTKDLRVEISRLNFSSVFLYSFYC